MQSSIIALLVVSIVSLFGICGLLFIWSYIQKRSEKQPANYSVIKQFYWIHFAEIICGALVIFGLTGLLGEMGLMSGYFKRHVGDIVLSIVSDTDNMRELLLPDKIRAIRIATMEASLGRKLEKGPGSFYEMVEKDVYPMMVLPIRKNYQIHLIHTIDTIATANSENDSAEVISAHNDTHWTYENPTDTAILFTQEINANMKPIKGIPNEDLFKLVVLMVDNDTIRIPVAQTIASDSLINFYGKYVIKINQTVRIQIVTDRFIPKDDNFTNWMIVPTKGLTLYYQHPGNMVPYAYVFGLGQDPIKCRDKTKLSHTWEYDGWMFKKHGIMLYWSFNNESGHKKSKGM